MRPVTEDAMKIEPVPWIKEYVDMETAYTDLTLHKTEDKLFSQKKIPCDGYKELFKENIPIDTVTRKRRKRKTVLITGEPGIGKTTICK